MFSFKNKIHPNLKYSLDNNLYKYFRVIIHCKKHYKDIEKKLISNNLDLLRTIPYLGIISANLSPKSIKKLLEYPEVTYISMDSLAVLCGKSVLASNGITTNKQYALTGRDINIGIIDSGVFPHQDLTHSKQKIKTFMDLINNFNFPYDDLGHGTFISGIISGDGYLSNGLYRGVAPNSLLHVAKAFNLRGRGYISDILYAIYHFLIENKELNIRILCLPFELLDNDAFVLSCFEKLFQYAADNDVIVLIPGGNSLNPSDSIRGIVTLPNCITVGGIDLPLRTNRIGRFDLRLKSTINAASTSICSLNSNIKFISERDGHKLFSPPLDKPYTTYSGTSCACAFIAGVCALLLEHNNLLSFKDINALLKLSTRRLEASTSEQNIEIFDLSNLLSSI